MGVIIHGATLKGKITVEYRAWAAMMSRCCNPDHKSFKNYGGRGIKVCRRWHDFRNFLADMGPRPAGRYTIERVNNNGDYEPSNCIWLLHGEQSKNRRKQEPWKAEKISRSVWYTRHGSIRNPRNTKHRSTQ